MTANGFKYCFLTSNKILKIFIPIFKLIYSINFPKFFNYFDKKYLNFHFLMTHNFHFSLLSKTNILKLTLNVINTHFS